MKRFIRGYFLVVIAVFLMGGICVSNAYSAEKSAPAKNAPAASGVKTVEQAAPPAATSSATSGVDLLPAGVKHAEKPSMKPVEIEPADLIANISAAYKEINSFTVVFTVSQDVPKKKIDEDRIKKLESRYVLKYKESGDPGEDEYLLRLEGKKGFNNRTTVVHAPGKDGDYVYRVYKPAIPKGTSLKSGNPLVEDVSHTLPIYAIQELISLADDRDTKKKAYYNPKMDRLTLEITSEKTGMAIRSAGPLMPYKIIAHFDPRTFYIQEQEVRVRMKKDGEFWFHSRMKWMDFDPKAKVTEEDIISAPKF